MNAEELLRPYPHMIERRDYWRNKPYLVRLIGLGGGFVDFTGQPHKIDILGRGDTPEEAAQDAIAKLLAL